MLDLLCATSFFLMFYLVTAVQNFLYVCYKTEHVTNGEKRQVKNCVLTVFVCFSESFARRQVTTTAAVITSTMLLLLKTKSFAHKKTNTVYTYNVARNE